MSLIVAIVAVIVACGLGYLIGRAQRERTPDASFAARDALPLSSHAPDRLDAPPAPLANVATANQQPQATEPAAQQRADVERARVIRSFEGEAALVRRDVAARDAQLVQLADFAAERRTLFNDLADARAQAARYRQIVVDLEDNAPPPLLGAGSPDDLKLIVGVGPVLERMLHQLGITTYRQIARWSERDIDDVDARLPEFPGRIRRDGWVAQAKALHQSKYGTPVPPRDRG